MLQRQIRSIHFKLQQIFKYLLRTEPDIKHSAYPRFTLEMALLQASQLKSLESFDAVLHTLNTLGEKFSYFKQQPKVIPTDQAEMTSTQPIDIVQKAIEIFRGAVITLTPECQSSALTAKAELSHS